MRRLIPVLAIVLACTGCTNKQWLSYVSAVLDGHRAEADAAALAYEAERAADTAGRPCPEWYDLARSAGFTGAQWREPLSRILFRESRCDPNADNPTSTASGAAQIVVGTWRASCPDMPWSMRYDAETNLACAYQVWLRGGWSHWATY